MFYHEIGHFLHRSGRELAVDGAAGAVAPDAARVFAYDGIDAFNVGGYFDGFLGAPEWQLLLRCPSAIFL